MGRRRRHQDTTQVAESSQNVGSYDNQLQEIQNSAINVNSTESENSQKQVDEIPYEDRPIPEAYFPPEDETPQEFMPEPNIQQTPKYKIISKKELDALKFDVKQIETKSSESKSVEQKQEGKENSVGTNNIDFSALMFDVKKQEQKTSEAQIVEANKTEQAKESKGGSVSTNKVEIPNIRIDVDKLISRPELAKINKDSLASDSTTAISDSLLATRDSLANDSLGHDSLAFVPVEEPKVQREIVSIDGKELPETINNAWWYTPAIFIIFLAYVIIIRDRKNAIFSELKSFVKPNTDGSIFGFQWLQNSKYKFFLSSLGVITSSMYLFLANNKSISAIWLFFLAVTIFVVGKKMMLTLLEYIYFAGANVESMSGAFMVLVRQTGLMLIPSVLGLSFAPEEYRPFFIYFGIIIVGVAIFAFNLKVIINFLRGITSVFYLILYLCTLEVIPVAIFFVLGLLPRL